MRVSPAELKQLEKKLNFQVSDLQELFKDIMGLQDLSFEEIQDLNAKAKHIYPDLNKFYYQTREEMFESYY